jgi:hypothetical protein
MIGEWDFYEEIQSSVGAWSFITSSFAIFRETAGQLKTVYGFLMSLVGTRDVKTRFLVFALMSALSSVIPALRLWCASFFPSFHCGLKPARGTSTKPLNR